jgi:hypothetical protein
MVLSCLFTLWESGCTKKAVSSTNDTDYDAYLANVWFSLAYNRVKADGISPPPASRIYGYFGITLYEALIGSDSKHQSVAGQLNGGLTIPSSSTTSYHWPTVANAAVATIMTELFAGKTVSLAAINETRDSFETLYASEEGFAASVTRGEAIGNAMVAWSRTDGYATRSTSYTPSSDPGSWETTPPGFAAALEPGWGALRTFVIDDGGAVPPSGAPAYSTNTASAWHQAALEVYSTTGDLGANLTQDQIDIAHFWADGPVATGTPPGHSMYICKQIIEQKELSLIEAAEAYARVGLSVADAFIACWDAKYDTNLMRPVTYIQRFIDSNWDPLLTTPNFPTYTSGHATESGASTKVMADLWGDNTPFTDHTHDSRGLKPRSFSTFTQAGQESAVSRLYGGIHFIFDNDHGFTMGQTIGTQVTALPWRKSTS